MEAFNISLYLRLQRSSCSLTSYNSFPFFSRRMSKVNYLSTLNPAIVSILLKRCKDSMHYGAAYWDEYYSHSVRIIIQHLLSRCFQNCAGLFLRPWGPWLHFWRWKTYSDDYAVKLYLCPGPVKGSDLWICQTFWILRSFIPRAKGCTQQ